jgi:hypothetical protein
LVNEVSHGKPKVRYVLSISLGKEIPLIGSSQIVIFEDISAQRSRRGIVSTNAIGKPQIGLESILSQLKLAQ